MMKGRDYHHGKKGPVSTDLLVCFPSRTHLSLMPKPICSPARPSEPSKRHNNHQSHRLKKSAAQASPLMWAKSKSEMVSEPTSPKVTCAGQIKVRQKTGKSWQSVMEEIEKMHKTTAKKQRNRAKSGWAEALGFKKEVLQFLTCLRTIRFDLRCFGSFNHAGVTSDDDDDDDEEEEEEEDAKESSETVFSKWFMVLQEEQNRSSAVAERDKSESDAPAVPPANALLLMRCRSAPAKSWLEERDEEGEEDEDDEREDEEKRSNRSLRFLMDEDEKRKANESVVIMRYKISSDIAKETWVVGGIKDPLSRSRSWKR